MSFLLIVAFQNCSSNFDSSQFEKEMGSISPDPNNPNNESPDPIFNDEPPMSKNGWVDVSSEQVEDGNFGESCNSWVRRNFGSKSIRSSIVTPTITENRDNTCIFAMRNGSCANDSTNFMCPDYQPVAECVDQNGILGKVQVFY